MLLAYAVPGAGRALIDRELYLPRAWTDDRDRCRQAGIPDDRCFATKPELARQMINCFQAAKNQIGLDHYQVRRYDAWYRHNFPDTPAA